MPVISRKSSSRQNDLPADIPSALRTMLPRNQVITDPVELLTYDRDAARETGTPEAVVMPLNTDEVVKVTQWAAGRGIPLVGRGAGTGLSGGAVAEHGGVIVEFARMNRVLDVDTVGRSVVFEPGVINQTLDEMMKARGLYFPPDPASGRSATLGGNIAENAGGPHCFKYGVTTNYITGLEVVLANGSVLRTGGLAADYPEFDLVGLLTGSEGTLALITQASARLLRAVPAVRTLMAAFNSIEAAGRAVSAVIARGLAPATLEMMEQRCMQIVEDYLHCGLPIDARAGLIVETDGYPESVTPQMDEVAAILREFGARDLRIARTAAERDLIWYGRKSTAGAFARVGLSLVAMDGTVPRSHLAEALSAIDRISRQAGLLITYVFHAGDGNLHPNVFFDAADDDQVRRMEAASDRIMEICVEAGGSITGEHGVGSHKRRHMTLMFNAAELDAFRDIKQVFDPKNLLNPGKILPDPSTWPAAKPRRLMTPDHAGEDSSLTADPGALAQPFTYRHLPSPADDLWWSLFGATRPADETPDAQPDGVWAAANDTPATWEMSQSGRTDPDTGTPRPVAPIVIAPASADEAADVLYAWTCEADAPGVRLRGGGTKSANLPATQATLSTDRLQGIRVYAPEDLYVTVGAGTRLDELQAELTHRRMWTPLASPWPDATVGGIISTNFNAPLRMRYGAARDVVLALTAALPDGRVLRAGRPVVKNVAGYDIAKLFIGSYGTLGLITDVTLKLAPLPRARATLIIPVNDLAQALACGARLLRICLVASSLLLCRGADMPADAAGLRPSGGARYVLVYTAEGMVEDVRAELLEVRALAEAEGLTRLVQLEGVSGTDIWARWLRAGTPTETTLRMGVPPKTLGSVMIEVISTVGKAPLVADLASGLVHLRTGEVGALRRLAQPVGGYVLVLNHVEAKVDPWGHRPDGLELMRALKARWDPRGILNPGAFII